MAYAAELLATMLLIVLGNGVVANVVLEDTKGSGSGWIVVAFGWGMAVFVAVFSASDISGAHLNPARDLGPRLAHAVLPVPGKRDSDWPYAAIPALAPLAAGGLAGLVARLVRTLS